MRILFTPSLDAASPKASDSSAPEQAAIEREKPLEAPVPDPAPAPIPAPVPLATLSQPPQISLSELDARVKKNFEEFKTLLLAEWRQLQLKSDTANARSQGEEQIRHNSQQIATLADEVAALRKTLVDLQLQREAEHQMQQKKILAEPELSKPLPIPPELVTPKAEIPVPIESKKPETPLISVPERSDLLNALAGPAITPEKNERKVAFFTKLWDYLNQPAFETSTNKTDRTQ